MGGAILAKTSEDSQQDFKANENANANAAHWTYSRSLIAFSIGTQMLGSLCFFIALRILAPDQILRAAGNVIGVLGAVAAWVLFAHGRVRAAVNIHLYGMWFIVTAIATFVGGVRAPLVIGYPVLILLAGWLLGKRSAWTMTGLALAATLGFLAAGVTGVLPANLPSSTMLYGIVQAILCVLAMLLIIQVLNAYQARLKELNQTTSELSALALDLQESNARLSAVFHGSPIGISISRLDDGRLIEVNRAALETVGYALQEVIGQSAMALGVFVEPKQRDAAMALLRERGSIDRVELDFRKKSGEQAVVELSGRIIEVRGHPLVFGMWTDITSRKLAQEKINSLAFHDPLSNLPNRRLLLDRLHQALLSSSRRRGHGALLYLDLDHFKMLNDTRGHAIGDLLLQQVARRLLTCIREGDTAARFGGDEFVVLLENLSADAQEAATQAGQVAQKIIAVLSQPYLLEQATCLSTPSIGVALFGDGDKTTDELLQQADLAMYQAKSSGGCALRFFSQDMQSPLSARSR